MKKVVLSLLMCSALTVPAVAMDGLTQEEKIKNMMAYNMLSEDINYTGEILINKAPDFYTVTVPAGVLKANNSISIPSFSFPLKENGVLDGKQRYQVNLDKFAQIFPSLDATFKSHNVALAAVHYTGDFVPDLDLVEKQLLQINNLVIPVDDATKVSVGLVQFTDKSVPAKNDSMNQNSSLSLKNFKLSHPLLNISVQNFNLDVNVPQSFKEKTPLAQILKTPKMTQRTTLSNVQISSALMPDETLSFDFTETLDVKQDQTKGKDFNMFVKGKANISNIKTKNISETPSDIEVVVNAQGFNFEQLLAYSTASQKLTNTMSLPDTPKKKELLKTLEDETEKAYDSLIEKMSITVEKISVKSDKYTVLLKGKVDPKKETFKGTLAVSNFSYLAPEPTKVDEVACKAVMDKMLDGTLKGDAFKTEYKKTCDDNRGPLDMLRPYATSARHIKTANGEDSLVFDVEIKDDDLYINGQKIEDAPFMD